MEPKNIYGNHAKSTLVPLTSWVVHNKRALLEVLLRVQEMLEDVVSDIDQVRATIGLGL